MTIPPLISIKLAAYGALGALAVIAALATALWYRGVELRSSQVDLRSVKIDIEQCRKTIRDHEKAERIQNEAIEQLKSDRAQKQLEAAQAVADAVRARQSAEAKLKRLEGLQRDPTPAGATCKTADAEIVKALKK